MVDFRALFRDVGIRRGMYGLDPRYSTLVAFVEGCDAATNAELLSGFRDWLGSKLLGQPKSNIAWWAIIAGVHVGECLEGSRHISDLPPELDEQLCADLLRFLDQFLEERAT